jgi:hypothetical protein
LRNPDPGAAGHIEMVIVTASMALLPSVIIDLLG